MRRRRWPKRSASPSAIISEKRTRIAFANELHPQTRDVVETRAEPLGIEVDGDDVDANTAALVVAWPDTYRRLWRSSRQDRRSQGRRRRRHLRRRSAGSDDHAGAGQPRRRYRGGLHAALRRADRLRRTARRLLRRFRQADAADARTPRRPVGRYQGPARLPARAADARTAYPPRQGDLQHLHRAGAARQHGDGLCHLARPGRPAGDRQPCARPCLAAGRGPEARRASKCWANSASTL